MEHDFWHERWREQRLGFHRSEVNPRLIKHVDVLPAPPSRIFVPLCGKSVDMTWLEERGHQIVGIELAERAVVDYFGERQLEPASSEDAPFQRYAHGSVLLYCGDFFALEQRHTGQLDAVYDRASLVALPEDMRTAYAEHLTSLLLSGTPYLLLVFEYPQHEKKGPPFSIDRGEVDRLFAEQFEISELSRESVEPRIGPDRMSWLQIAAYRMLKR
jgi:thiopurine S-methyltransferase